MKRLRPQSAIPWLFAAMLGLTAAFSAQAAPVCATPGAAGVGSLSGVVNDYWAGNGSPSAGATSVTLGARRSGGAGNSINAGDLVLIIQMQDADINSGNTSAYGSGGTSGAGSTAVNRTGLYEYVVATNSVGAGGGTVSFTPTLTNSYRTRAYTAGSNGQSTWQAIRIPSYSSATATNVTSPAWNGATGGVVALDVVEALSLSGTTSINVAGLGFRGGAGRQLAGGAGASTDYRTLATNNANAAKGEGIAGRGRYLNNTTAYNAAPVLLDTGVEGYPNGSYARGAPGNAGGGGTDGRPSANDENSGGGGGGNYGAGGRGGNAWNSNQAVGGLGGAPYSGTLDYNRIFMGGGGGAGTTNNATADAGVYSAPPGLSCGSGALCSSGAVGGGIVLVRAGSVSGTGLIDARGADAYNVLNDSAGGGGAGGTIVLQTLTGGNATVNASGGNGGNAWRSTTSTADRHGPGGGGGGGFIAYSPASGLTLTATYAGGTSGRTSNNDSYGTTSSSGGLSAFDTPNVPGAQPGAFCPPAIKAVRLFTDGGTAGQVDPGDTVEYTVIYRNGSSSAISGFNITDALPGGLNYVAGSLAIAASGGASGSANAGYDGNASTSLLSAATTLPSGGIIRATFRALVPSGSTSCGNQLLNQASSVQSGGETLGLTDNADNSQNSSGLPAAAYLSQSPYGTGGVADPTGITVYCAAISGRIFEDVNYGGGAGRDFASASGQPVQNARVELYDGSGNFVGFTTTDASGSYSFGGLGNGSYSVRAVNDSVASTRGGCAAGTCLPVQTWRTDASSGTAVAVADRVGGENPVLSDASNGSTTLAALSTASTVAQSISPIAYAGSPIGGVDFGFNFDTVVNVNNARQGSLRQFITNANALGGDGTLTQSGFRIDSVTGGAVPLASGVEQSIFMIPDGNARPGLRAGLASQLSAGVAVIPVTVTLPSLSSTIRIEGGTQTYNVGNTNNTSLGTGGTVGVSAVTVPQLNGPEVQLQDGPAGSSGIAIGLDVQAPNVTLRGMAIVGFGGTAASNSNGNIRIGNFTGTTINQNVLGATALSYTDPAGTLRGTGDAVRINSGDSGIISQNLIGFSDGNGIGFDTASNTDGWVLEYNEIRGNAIGSSSRNGIELDQNTAGAPNTIRYNLIVANAGAGIHLASNGADNNLITDNTVAGSGGTNEPGGIRNSSGDNNTISLNLIHGNVGPGIEFLTGSSGNAVSQNVIHGNAQSGIEVDSGATTNTLTRNSTYNNARIGIDLLTSGQGATPASPYYSQNDNGDGDTGGNNVLNFPQITGVTALGGNMTVSGIAPAGATIEIFIADGDASGFGEGQTYIASFVEGSGSDAAAGTSANTVTCGTGAVSVTMNNFSFTFPRPGNVSSGSPITTTATVGGNTSEFSCNAAVVDNSPSLIFLKTLATYSDPFNGTTNPKNIPGAEIDYTLRVSNTGPGSVDSDTLIVVDPIPANAELFVGNLSGGLPFLFTDSSSGLTCGAGCMDVSTDGGSNWIPVPAGSYNPLITHIRFRPSGAMIGDVSPGPPSPYFDLVFRVRVK